jgi:hypothetical protein
MLIIPNPVRQTKTNGLLISAFSAYECSGGERLYVFPGRLSTFDILIKYEHNGSRLRTPKHVHWVVDLLLKKQANSTVSELLMNHLVSIWENVRPISSHQERQNLTPQYSEYPTRCAVLDTCGYFSVDFIILLAELLARQEKTNNVNAHMFGDVLDALQNSNDIFKIISAAGFSGR